MTDASRIRSAIDHIRTAVDVDEWAMEIAVDAMEKQIPKKVMGKEYGIDGYAVVPCGNCGEELDNLMWYFCPWCGQKIDWEEEE